VEIKKYWDFIGWPLEGKENQETGDRDWGPKTERWDPGRPLGTKDHQPRREGFKGISLLGWNGGNFFNFGMVPSTTIFLNPILVLFGI